MGCIKDAACFKGLELMLCMPPQRESSLHDCTWHGRYAMTPLSKLDCSNTCELQSEQGGELVIDTAGT